MFSARSQQDMSAMVSALSQVIGNTQNSPTSLQLSQNPNFTTSSPNTSERDLSQRVEDQGMCIWQNLFGYIETSRT